ncbi:MAG: DinB family protein [Chloroflexi bacterium]|nr:DinB family protein [Chloroflexota bacterium]
MDAAALVRSQAKEAHGFLEATMADVTPPVASYIPPGKANSVGVCYAHVVAAEDMVINGMLKGGAPLFASSWSGKTGVNEPMPLPGPGWVDYFPWTRRVKVNLPQLKDYSKAVFAATDAYLATLKSADLDREMDLSGAGLGKRDLAFVLTRLVIGHVDNFTGEISAIKGVQGLKGYPV